MRTDPFLVRRLPKYHLARIGFTLYSRLLERACGHLFDRCLLPTKAPLDLSEVEEGFDPDDTAVTAKQM